VARTKSKDRYTFGPVRDFMLIIAGYLSYYYVRDLELVRPTALRFLGQLATALAGLGWSDVASGIVVGQLAFAITVTLAALGVGIGYIVYGRRHPGSEFSTVLMVWLGVLGAALFLLVGSPRPVPPGIAGAAETTYTFLAIASFAAYLVGSRRRARASEGAPVSQAAPDDWEPFESV